MMMMLRRTRASADDRERQFGSIYINDGVVALQLVWACGVMCVVGPGQGPWLVPVGGCKVASFGDTHTKMQDWVTHAVGGCSANSKQVNKSNCAMLLASGDQVVHAVTNAEEFFHTPTQDPA
jgi:hypothetical protein